MTSTDTARLRELQREPDSLHNFHKQSRLDRWTEEERLAHAAECAWNRRAMRMLIAAGFGVFLAGVAIGALIF